MIFLIILKLKYEAIIGSHKCCVCVCDVCFMMHLKIEHFSLQSTQKHAYIYMYISVGEEELHIKNDFTILLNIFHFTLLNNLLKIFSMHTGERKTIFFFDMDLVLVAAAYLCVCICMYVILLASKTHASRSAVHTPKPNKSSKRTKATETTQMCQRLRDPYSYSPRRFVDALTHCSLSRSRRVRFAMLAHSLAHTNMAAQCEVAESEQYALK